MSVDAVSVDEDVIGFLDYNVDCSRTRYSIQIGLAVDFQIDSDHVSFGLPTQTDEGKQVPVLLANTSNRTVDRTVYLNRLLGKLWRWFYQHRKTFFC